jgi:hypothetical protein
MRDAKIMELYEGTSQIQRLVMASGVRLREWAAMPSRWTRARRIAAGKSRSPDKTAGAYRGVSLRGAQTHGTTS